MYDKKQIIIAAFLIITSLAHAGTPRVTGTYSNLHYNNESGDLSGMEVTIVYGAERYYAMVQCAEGVPEEPKITVVNVQKNKISFQLSVTGCPATVFQGTIASKGLTGKFDGTEWPGFLKRRKSYWQ